MYESFFGLKGHPFKLSPDPGFFYASSTHAKGMAYLHYGLQQGEGFVVVTGMPGTGKTTLLNLLTRDLSSKHFVVIKLGNTLLSIDDLFSTIAHLLGLKSPGNNRVGLLEELELHLQQLMRAGKHVLLLIDEAHNLSPRILEELRLLSNFQYRDKYTLQIFLLGQFQLEETLNLPEMVQLRQRVLVSHRLTSISQKEVGEYIIHRLMTAGWKGTPGFTGEAFRLIHHYTEGVPRQINTLTNRILLYVYLEENKYIDEQVVNEVIKELAAEPASYVYGRTFSDVDTSGKMNGSSKMWVRQEVEHNRQESSSEFFEPRDRVVSWPVSPLTYHQIDNRFPVDRSYPNAMKVPLSLVADVKSKNTPSTNQFKPVELKIVGSNGDEEKSNYSKSDETTNEMTEKKDSLTEETVFPEKAIMLNHEVDQKENMNTGTYVQNKLCRNRILRLSAIYSSICIFVIIVFFISEWFYVKIEVKEEVSQIVNKEDNHIASINQKEIKLTEVFNSSGFMVHEKSIPVDLGVGITEPISDLVENENIIKDKSQGVVGDDSVMTNTKQIILVNKENIARQHQSTINEGFSSKSLLAKESIIDGEDDSHKIKMDKVEEKSIKKISDGQIQLSESIVAAIGEQRELAEPSAAVTIRKVTETTETTETIETSHSQMLTKSEKIAEDISPALSEDIIRGSLQNKHTMLGELIKKFEVSYNEGNIEKFFSLFSSDVESNDVEGIRQLKREYKKLFSVTDSRLIAINDFLWDFDSGGEMDADYVINGDGGFQLTIVERGRSKPVFYTGGITLSVDMDAPRPVITKIFYVYNQ